jgi:RNA polymerase sigma-70 factor (ECF subfamily)
MDVQRTDEADLVRRLRAGDRTAFRTFVALHQEGVYALALRLMDNEAEAMDLTQDVFVEAWKGMTRFRQESRVGTWLHGIAVRVARQQWRRLRRRSEREGRYASESHDDAVVRAMPEASIDLERAIAELPPRMRMALVLHHIEGLPQSEVARLMGVAEGTVKAHVHSARKILQERLS